MSVDISAHVMSLDVCLSFFTILIFMLGIKILLYLSFKNRLLYTLQHMARTGKSLYRGKGMVPHVQSSTNNGLGCLLKAKKNLTNQQPILQLVDDCTSGIVTFPLYRDFPGQDITDRRWNNWCISIFLYFKIFLSSLLYMLQFKLCQIFYRITEKKIEILGRAKVLFMTIVKIYLKLIQLLPFENREWILLRCKTC